MSAPRQKIGGNLNIAPLEVMAVHEWMGYTHFFVLCTVLAIPGMLMLLKVAPWNGREKTADG